MDGSTHHLYNDYGYLVGMLEHEYDAFDQIGYGDVFYELMMLDIEEVEGVRIIKKKAEEGESVVCSYLWGRMLIYGDGVEQDAFLGKDFLESAIEADDICSMLVLAIAYLFGKTALGTDAYEARRLLEMASKADSVLAMKILVDLLSDGEHFPPEPEEVQRLCDRIQEMESETPDEDDDGGEENRDDFDDGEAESGDDDDSEDPPEAPTETHIV